MALFEANALLQPFETQYKAHVVRSRDPQRKSNKTSRPAILVPHPHLALRNHPGQLVSGDLCANHQTPYLPRSTLTQQQSHSPAQLKIPSTRNPQNSQPHPNPHNPDPGSSTQARNDVQEGRTTSNQPLIPIGSTASGLPWLAQKGTTSRGVTDAGQQVSALPSGWWTKRASGSC